MQQINHHQQLLQSWQEYVEVREKMFDTLAKTNVALDEFLFKLVNK